MRAGEELLMKTARALRPAGALLLWATTAAFALSCAGPANDKRSPSPDEERRIGAQIESYFKKAANLPADVSLEVTDLSPAEVPGMLKGTIEVTAGEERQQVPFLASLDGRYVVRGEFTDVTVDPLVAVMSKISLATEPVRGAANARVTIVEYSDFQCPFCARAYQMLEDQVLREYGEKVKLVFKHMPLVNIHPWAEGAAIAAECAAVQDPASFWKMYDFLFRNQESLTADNLRDRTSGAAREAGLDGDKFGRCFDGKETLAQVQADAKEAEAVGVNSTPTFFVNGRRIEGAVPYEEFRGVLDQELAKFE